MKSSSNIHIYKKLIHLRLREHYKKESRKNVRARRSGSFLKRCLLRRVDATSIMSHQHNCLNMSSASTTSVGMPKLMRKDHEVFHGLHKGM